MLLVLLVAGLCLLGPALAPLDPEKIDFLGRFRPPGPAHWLGGDQLEPGSALRSGPAHADAGRP